MESCHDGCESDTAGALDIVVEARTIRAVLFKETPCCIAVSHLSHLGQARILTVSHAKVFEVNVRLGVELSHGLDEGVDEFIVLLTPDALLFETEVEIIVQELLIVRSTVENHGQSAVGMDTGTKSRQDQFGYRDENTAYALVPNTKNLLAVWVMLVAGRSYLIIYSPLTTM